MAIVTRTLVRSPKRLQIRTNLFFSVVLGHDGRNKQLPALANALTHAQEVRRRTGRPVWIEDAQAPAYQRPVRRAR